MIYKFLFIVSLIPFLMYSQPAEAQNMFMLGNAYEQRGEYVKAGGIYEQLYNSYPQNYGFFDAHNRVLLQLKKYDQSVVIIQARLKLTPSDLNLYGLLGKTYTVSGKQDLALKTWISATETNPSDVGGYKIMANFATEARDFDAALMILNKGKEVNRNPIYFAYELAYLYTIKMDFKNVALEYIQLIDTDPNQSAQIQSRLFSLNRFPDAIATVVKEFEKKLSLENKTYSFITAELYLSLGKYPEAFELYKTLDKSDNRGGYNVYNFANKALAIGHITAAISAFNYVLENYPGSPLVPATRLGIAKAYEAQCDSILQLQQGQWKPIKADILIDPNQTVKALEAYREVLKLFGKNEGAAIEAIFRMGILFVNTGSPDEAIKSFNKIWDGYPTSVYNPSAGIELGKIFLKQGNTEKARFYFNKVIEFNFPDAEKISEARYLLMRVLFYENHFDLAREMITTLSNNIKDSHANDALELSLIISGNSSDSSMLVTYAAAELEIEKKEFEKAEKSLRAILTIESPALLNQLASFRLAQVELALNRTDSSMVRLKKIIEDKNNIYADDSAYLLAQIFEYLIKDVGKTIESYEIIILKFPNSLYLDKAREKVLKLRNINK